MLRTLFLIPHAYIAIMDSVRVNTQIANFMNSFMSHENLCWAISIRHGMQEVHMQSND